MLQTKHRAAKALAVAALLAAPRALADSPPAAQSPTRASWFFDRDRRVEVARLAPKAKGALTPVRLRYEGRSHDVPAFVDDTVIVTIEPGAEPEVEARGGKLLRPLMPSLGLWLARDTQGGDGIDLAARLRSDRGLGKGVRRAVPNLYLHRKVKGAHTPDDPRYPGQWFFANLKMPEVWGRTVGDPKITVVVVDTGCDMSHPDLVANMDPGMDVVDDDMDPSPILSEDGSAHGTSCAGLVAASTDNGVGVAGACPECRLRCVRMLSDAPTPISADVDAFQFALDVDAAVVSNSWGFVNPMPAPQPLEDAVNNVFDHGRGGRGALVLFAMGNDDREVGDDEIEAVRGVLGIGAINNFDEQTPFTNSGNCVDLVAPTGTLTTDISGPGGSDPSDYTNLFGGTSSACPVAAGIAGLLASVAPERTSQELYDVMIGSARPAPFAVPDAMGHDQVYGYGIIDPVKALDMLLGPVGGDGGAGGAGAGGAGVGGGGSGGVGTMSGETSEGGCSCGVAPSPGGGAAVFAMGLAAVIMRGRRRRSA